MGAWHDFCRQILSIKNHARFLGIFKNSFKTERNNKWVPEKTWFFVKNYLHIREPFQMKNLILCKKHHITGSQNSHNIKFLTVLETIRSMWCRSDVSDLRFLNVFHTRAPKGPPLPCGCNLVMKDSKYQICPHNKSVIQKINISLPMLVDFLH